MKIGYLPLVLACAALALASCGVQSSPKKTADQIGVSPAVSGNEAPVNVA